MAANQFNNWPVVGIKVYYSDGTVLSTKDTPLSQFSLLGIQVVNVYYGQVYASDGRTLNYFDCIAGEEIYWLDPVNLKDYGVARLMNEVPQGKLAFKGELLRNKQDFLDIYNLAYQDREF